MKKSAPDSSWHKIRNHIKVLTTVSTLLISIACGAAEKPRPWQLGLLRDMGSESWTSTSTRPVTCTNGNCTGGGTSSWGHETLTLQISDGEKTYIAERTLNFRWQHDPKVTENSLMKFAVQGDQLVLLGDDGREFKTRITKKRIDTLGEQVQECSLITEVLVHRLASIQDVDLMHVLGWYGRCGSAGIAARDLTLIQGVEHAVSSLLSEEQTRIAKKDGVTGVLPTSAVTPDLCSELVRHTNEKTSLPSAADRDLLMMFQQAEGCTTAQLQQPGGLPDPGISRTQMQLAFEGVRRLTGIGPAN